MLALTLLVLGDEVAANAALQRALDRTADVGDHPLSIAEAHTLAAQFHATRVQRSSQARGPVAADAATAFRSALVIARQQHARLWQKRVQCSLDA